jgi:hypothetical protein
VVLGRRALYGRAWRRTGSPLGPSNAYTYLTPSYNRSPNNSATFRRWRAHAHQHQKLLRRRQTQSCKHDGSRAAEAQRARRAADPRHESTCGHHTDGRRAWLPPRRSLWQQQESSAHHASVQHQHGAWLATWPCSHLGAPSEHHVHSRRAPAGSSFSTGCVDRHHALPLADARRSSPTSCGNVVSAFLLCPNST